jgi:hypothetical protein
VRGATLCHTPKQSLPRLCFARPDVMPHTTQNATGLNFSHWIQTPHVKCDRDVRGDRNQTLVTVSRHLLNFVEEGRGWSLKLESKTLENFNLWKRDLICRLRRRLPGKSMQHLGEGKHSVLVVLCTCSRASASRLLWLCMFRSSGPPPHSLAAQPL